MILNRSPFGVRIGKCNGLYWVWCAVTERTSYVYVDAGFCGKPIWKILIAVVRWMRRGL